MIKITLSILLIYLLQIFQNVNLLNFLAFIILTWYWGINIKLLDWHFVFFSFQRWVTFDITRFHEREWFVIIVLIISLLIICNDDFLLIWLRCKIYAFFLKWFLFYFFFQTFLNVLIALLNLNLFWTFFIIFLSIFIFWFEWILIYLNFRWNHLLLCHRAAFIFWLMNFLNVRFYNIFLC